MKKLVAGFLLSLCFVSPASIASEPKVGYVNLDVGARAMKPLLEKYKEGQTIAFAYFKTSHPFRLSIFAAFFCDHDKEISMVMMSTHIQGTEGSGSCVFKRNGENLENFYEFFD